MRGFASAAIFAIVLISPSIWTSASAADVGSPAPEPAEEFDKGDLIDTLPDGSPLYSRIKKNNRIFQHAGTAERSSRTLDQLMMKSHKGSASAKKAEESDEIELLLSKTDEELGEMARARGVIGNHEFVEELTDVKQRGIQVRSKLESSRSTKNKKERSQHPQERSVVVKHPGADEVPVHPAEETPSPSGSSSGSRKLLGGNIGCPDGRIAIQDTTEWPYSAQIVLGYASSYSSNKMDWNSCSATLIGQETALSAAHCFWDLEEGKWFNNYWWAPGYNSDNAADPSPLGMWQECYLATVPTAFTTENSYNTVAEFWDFAVMTFDVCNGPIRNGVNPSKPGQFNALSGFIYSLAEEEADILYSRGYPGSTQSCGRGGAESCDIRPWGDWGELTEMTEDFLDSETISISKGHSGSGIYMYWTDGKPYVTCIATSMWPCSDSNGVSDVMRCRMISELVRDFIFDVADEFSS